MKYSIYIISLVMFIGCHTRKSNSTEPEHNSTTNSSSRVFKHGIASGDPLSDAVIIWTRVSANAANDVVEGIWEISKNKEFNSLHKSGNFKTSFEKDFTVKIDVKELEAGTDYYYRFKALNSTSAIGNTKTTPTIATKLKFAVTSCSNYEWGYFNAYGRMSEEKNLNAIIHLGDYIYEYGVGVYGDTTLGRLHDPIHEIISLDDYRKRYAQYRMDDDLQLAHASYPFIAIWDDHEISNNAYVDGAQNHQDEEGTYTDRRAIAKQVYYEWMPIRETADHYRSFEFGNLASLLMLDERLAGRNKQVDSLNDPALMDPSRSMLGQTQFNWLINNLKKPNSKWKLIGNQVIFSYQNWGYENFSLNMDAWDGYPVEQGRLTDSLRLNNIKNVVFLTGDTHTSWAFESTNDPFKNYNKDTSEGAVAVEFGVTSITSANANETRDDAAVLEHESKVMSASLNPHLKYVNMRDHGYLLLTITDSTAIAEFKIVPTLKEKNPLVKTDKIFKVKSGSSKLEEISQK